MEAAMEGMTAAPEATRMIRGKAASAQAASMASSSPIHGSHRCLDAASITSSSGATTVPKVARQAHIKDGHEDCGSSCCQPTDHPPDPWPGVRPPHRTSTVTRVHLAIPTCIPHPPPSAARVTCAHGHPPMGPRFGAGTAARGQRSLRAPRAPGGHRTGRGCHVGEWRQHRTDLGAYAHGVGENAPKSRVGGGATTRPRATPRLRPRKATRFTRGAPQGEALSEPRCARRASRREARPAFQPPMTLGEACGSRARPSARERHASSAGAPCATS